jgi:hypothetical protein
MSATASAVVVPLLIFEAANCLMAVPASEVAHLEGSDPLFTENEGRAFDLGEYFTGLHSDGPWLRWGRGAQSATLRVKRVVDVVPVALSSLTPMPTLLRGQHRTRAFFAAGISGDDVFLLLDPARLNADSGLRDSSRLPDSSYRVSL